MVECEDSSESEERSERDLGASRGPLREGQESASSVLVEMITGVQSAMTYAGARTIVELGEKAHIGVQTAAGYGEGTPHGKLRR